MKLLSRFVWWGGCGVFRCRDCTPRYSIFNHELKDT